MNLKDETVAMETAFFPTTENELAELISAVPFTETLHTTIGGSLIWLKGKPMPWGVRQLALMRGVLNENMDGAGI